jgi:hypothetical protein
MHYMCVSKAADDSSMLLRFLSHQPNTEEKAQLRACDGKKVLIEALGLAQVLSSRSVWRSFHVRAAALRNRRA